MIYHGQCLLVAMPHSAHRIIADDIIDIAVSVPTIYIRLSTALTRRTRSDASPGAIYYLGGNKAVTLRHHRVVLPRLSGIK